MQSTDTLLSSVDSPDAQSKEGDKRMEKKRRESKTKRNQPRRLTDIEDKMVMVVKRELVN